MTTLKYGLIKPFLELMRQNKVALCTWTHGTQLVVQYDGEYESMNEYENDDPEFEEYYACSVIIRKIVFLDSRDGFSREELEPCVNDSEHRWFELSYHNVPQHYEPYLCYENIELPIQ